MEKYFSNNVRLAAFIFMVIILSSGCNKESVIEGFADVNPTTKTLNIDVQVNNSANTNVTLQFDNGSSVVLPFNFSIVAISGTSSNYRFFCNVPTNFRWAIETYIKRMYVGDNISENIFSAGGTPYFISAIKSGTNYSYTFAYSFRTNEVSYAAFKYTTTLSGKPSIIYGWINFTATDNKITLHKYAYAYDGSFKISQ